MKNRPIHENLDTSFVNLPALLRYLRRRQFIGRVRVELSGYEADVYLLAENQMRVREYDHIAGRVAEGEEALQRILIRSREPGGIINVYQTATDTESSIGKKEISASENNLPKPIVSEIKPANGNGAAKPDFLTNGTAPQIKAELPKPEENQIFPKPKLPNLPFEFTNKVEQKAKAKQLSTEERQLLLNLTGELLGTVDRSLAMAKLDFPTAFQKACTEISTDYPFMLSLSYSRGKVRVEELPSAKIFVAGLLDALRRVMDKLGANPKFGEVYRYATQRILALIHQRKPYYDKFSMTSPLQKILGT